METYQAVVLSGGGSKGPYGLGVLLALDKHQKEHKKRITPIYCGTSVGALNATLAAQGDLTKLDQLYAKLTTKDVLGTPDSKVKRRHLVLNLGRRPYHYFKNAALRKTIAANVHFGALRNSHLLICVTNYLTGALETFYRSDLIDEFLQREGALPLELRRLHHYHRIDSEEELVQVLLASTAIPFYFPPVEIAGSLYVDGGVGNNTPLRQAAYACRFLNLRDDAQLAPTICVVNDPGRFTIESSEENTDIFGVIRRSLDIFHNELVSDSRITWDRINKELTASQDRENRLSSIFEDLPVDIRESFRQRVMDVVRSSTQATRRIELPLYEIRPSAALVQDVLAFDPQVSKRLKHQGVADCLKKLEDSKVIAANDHRRWLEEIS
jgi:predicted acylesterase/phospholipase RssA